MLCPRKLWPQLVTGLAKYSEHSFTSDIALQLLVLAAPRPGLAQGAQSKKYLRHSDIMTESHVVPMTLHVPNKHCNNHSIHGLRNTCTYTGIDNTGHDKPMRSCIAGCHLCLGPSGCFLCQSLQTIGTVV